MKLLMRKDATGWHGAIPAHDESWSQIKNGDYNFVITRPRNIKFHRKFFALLTVALDMQDQFQTMDTFLDAIKICAGEFEAHQIRLPKIEEELDGQRFVVLKPKSISFAKMDQTAFDAFYSRVIDALITNFCPGSTAEEMDRAAMEYLRFA